MMNLTYLIPISGRPNAGKTSLVNYIARTKGPVGKYAGTTLKIIPVPLIKNLSLVDLPGFGRITKRSKQMENKLKDAIVQFYEDPKNRILMAIHVIDLSTFHYMVESLEKKNIIPLDIEMIQFITEVTNFPPIVVFNKIDKLKKAAIDQNLQLFKSYNIPEIEEFIVSLKTKEGCRVLRNRIKAIAVEKLGSSYQHW
jgi:GTP-binding protein EngB required for normal cell division